jgi:hypothetical protein
MLNFYENFFENPFLQALKGTQVFDKTIHSPVPSVFIGSGQCGIFLSMAIMLENAFKKIENINEEEIAKIIEQQQNTKIKHRYFVQISNETNFRDGQVQSSIFYLLELAKRGEILTNFVIVQNENTIFNPISSEIESRIFELNTIKFTTPQLWEIEKIVANASLPLKPHEISRDYAIIEKLFYSSASPVVAANL